MLIFKGNKWHIKYFKKKTFFFKYATAQQKKSV